MKQGGKRLASEAFTMVEVLIVLAVSSMIFISAVLIINGRQASTDFTTSINNMQQQLQQIINQAQSGYFPNVTGLSCNGTTSPIRLSASSTGQGSNGGCIFMGKAIQFGLGSGDLAEQLGVIPLVGNQFKPSTYDPVTSITQAKPRALYPLGVDDAATSKSAVETINMGGGLTVAKNGSGTYLMSYKTPTGATGTTGLIAFMSGDPSGAISSGGDTDSGFQQMSLYAIGSSAGSQPNMDIATAARKIGNYPQTPPVAGNLVSASSVTICLLSAGTNQSGLFTIDSGLHVTLDVKSDKTC